MAKKANSSNHCSFCGRSENEVTLLISGVSGFICDMCAEQAHEIVNETFKGSEKSRLDISLSTLPKPKQIKDFLDQYVIGQDAAKRFLSVSVYNHYKRILQKNMKDDVEIEKIEHYHGWGPPERGKRFLHAPLQKCCKFLSPLWMPQC